MATDDSTLFKALAAAQREIMGAAKTAVNPHLKNRYADLASVLDAIREPLTSRGIAIVQLTIPGPQGYASIETRLCHESGASIGCETSIKLSKDDAQGYGSAITYARRYALMSMVGVAGIDDDGEAAVGRSNGRQMEPKTMAAHPFVALLEKAKEAVSTKELEAIWRENITVIRSYSNIDQEILKGDFSELKRQLAEKSEVTP